MGRHSSRAIAAAPFGGSPVVPTTPSDFMPICHQSCPWLLPEFLHHPPVLYRVSSRNYLPSRGQGLHPLHPCSLRAPVTRRNTRQMNNGQVRPSNHTCVFCPFFKSFSIQHELEVTLEASYPTLPRVQPTLQMSQKRPHLVWCLVEAAAAHAAGSL